MFVTGNPKQSDEIASAYITKYVIVL